MSDELTFPVTSSSADSPAPSHHAPETSKGEEMTTPITSRPDLLQRVYESARRLTILRIRRDRMLALAKALDAMRAARRKK